MGQVDVDKSSFGVGSLDMIEPEYRLALLREWHGALADIIAADPSAHETRRTIETIESEIATIEMICKKNCESAEPKSEPTVIGS